MKRILLTTTMAIAITLIGLASASPASASSGANISIVNSGECGETTFSGSNALLSNIYLVVSVDGVTQYFNVPQDATSDSISVGGFFTQTPGKTILWHVFGGGERNYDDPLWNGYGGPTFAADINAYADSVGGDFSWVIAGPDDPNPFVTWNEIVVESCAPLTKADCKKGGWELYGFRNQGQCVSTVNHNT